MPSYTLPYTGVLDVPANTMLGNNTGSAAAAIGMTQAQTLTFLGDPGGAFGADAATQITPSTAIVLDEATGNEIDWTSATLSTRQPAVTTPACY